MDNQIIINKLKHICFKEKKFYAQNFKERHYQIWTKKGFTVSLEKDESVIFDEIVKEVFSDPIIHQNYSVNDVEKSLQEIISKILKGPRKKREEKIKNEVDLFFQSLSANINDWVFIFPIENLKLSIRQLKINDVILYRFNRYRTKKYLEMVRSNLDQNKYYKNKDNVKSQLINQIQKYTVSVKGKDFYTSAGK